MATMHINSENFDKEVLQAQEPVLIDFWASWCGPCRMVAPVVEKLSEEYEGRLKVAKVDVDECPDIAQRYGVMSIPTLIVIKDGQEQDKIIGAAPRSRLAQMVDQYL